MKVIDNYLNKEEANRIEDQLMSVEFPWYYNKDIIYGSAGLREERLNNFQFTHNFYSNYTPNSSYFNILKPLLFKLDAVSILRIKSNLLTKTDKIIEYEKHIDQEKNVNYKVAIYYVNNCNGYTKIKDTKIFSKKNRVLLFEGNQEHLGTSCTNQNRRVIININYI
jgi:hypothetical protein